MEPSPKKVKYDAIFRTDMDLRNIRLWLDLLPLDVCQSIFFRILQEFTIEPALQLAETSPHLAAAVKAALRNEIFVNHDEDNNCISLTRWNAIMGDDLRRADFIQQKDRFGVVDFLRRPRLERVGFDYDSDCLRAISGTRSLQSLCIRKGLHAVDDHQLFLEVLDSLNLTELKLECSNVCSRDCLFWRCSAELEPWELAVFCENVSVLDINCYKVEPKRMWKFIVAFPALKEVTLHGSLRTMRETAIRKLRTLDKVNVKTARRKDVSVISSIGANISQLCFWGHSSNALSAEQLKALSSCPHLETLEAFIQEGAEAELMTIGSHIRRLELTWIQRNIDPLEEHVPAYKPSPEFFSFLSQLPFLSYVHLFQMLIDGDELEELLQGLGLQLREFAMSAQGLGEQASERIAFILEKLASNNPNLQYFYVLHGDSSNPELKHRDVSASRVNAALSVLQGRSKLISDVILRHPFFDCVKGMP